MVTAAKIPVNRSKFPIWAQAASILFLALLFCLSAVDKLFHYSGFVNALRNYAIVPRGMAPYLALPVIIVELTISLGVLVPSLRRTVALLGASMMAVFTIALGTNYIYGGKGI